MKSVITLIVKPGDAENLVQAEKRAQETLGSTLKRSVLAPDEATDLVFDTAPDENITRLSTALKSLPVDFVVQPEGTRDKKLLLADMDSTIIENECIDELADFANVRGQVAKITERAMQGALNFEESLLERVTLLRGLKSSVLDQVYGERIRIRPMARTLLATAKARGLRTVLVSGGFTFFTGRIAAEVGFDRHVANQLEERAGELTGQVLPPLSGPATKLNILQEECGAVGCSAQEVIAVGDGANDIPMLQAAGLGVAVHAKPVTADAANVAFRHTGLEGLLFLLGIPRSEWVNKD